MAEPKAEYEKRLSKDLYDQFVAEYSRRLFALSERTRPFFFPFKRILCWGQRLQAESRERA